MTKKNPVALPYPADLRQHVQEAHAKFFARVKQAIAQAEAAATREYTPDLSDVAAGRRSCLKRCEAHSAAEAVRRYGGPRGGLLRVEDRDIDQFLSDVRAMLEARITALSKRSAKLSRDYFRRTPDSDKQRDIQSTLLVTLGWLDGYKRVLELFDDCFHKLHVRVVMA